jgi:ATP-dependent RNA helicase DDX19/DBP5
MADLASRISKPSDAPVDDATPAAPAAPAAAEGNGAEGNGAEGNGAEGNGAEQPVDDGVQRGLIETNYDVEVKLSDLQADQESPLYSGVSSFEELGLPKSINDGLLAMNFKKPSKIQERALPLMISDPPTNMIAQSQSGTGKTAAFVLTVLSRVDLTKPTQPQALLLAPSRELARQIQGVIQTIGQFCENLVVEAAIPGSISRETGVRASVVVGTPGTVMDLIRRRQFDVSQLKVLVIDEADNMLDQQGMGDQCVRVKGYVLRDYQSLRVC